MPIELDRTSAEPLYRQVATSLRRTIDDGRLRQGQQVPSVRVLAGRLGVGRLTIETAFEQLTAERYLVGRVGFGTVVAPEPPGLVNPWAGRSRRTPNDSSEIERSRKVTCLSAAVCFRRPQSADEPQCTRSEAASGRMPAMVAG